MIFIAPFRLHLYLTKPQSKMVKLVALMFAIFSFALFSCQADDELSNVGDELIETELVRLQELTAQLNPSDLQEYALKLKDSDGSEMQVDLITKEFVSNQSEEFITLFNKVDSYTDDEIQSTGFLSSDYPSHDQLESRNPSDCRWAIDNYLAWRSVLNQFIMDVACQP